MGNSVRDGYITTASLAPINVDIDFDKFMSRHDPMGEMQDAILDGIEKGVQRLSMLLDKRYHDMLAKHGLSASDMASNYTITVDGLTVELTIGTDYAIYVEYGTGIVGEHFPHKQPKIDWTYDVNGHDIKGWYYKDDNGIWHRTYGQKSRPFIYDTWIWARSQFTTIIDGQVRQAIKRWERVVNS